MKHYREVFSSTDPMSSLFRDFHRFLQTCIDDLDQLSAQQKTASVSHSVSESNSGSEHEG